MKNKSFLFFLIFLSFVFVFWWFRIIGPVDTSLKDQRRFVIQKGLTVSQIGNKLSEEGLIKSPLAFKLYLQFKGKTGNIKAGEYRLSPSEDMKTIVQRLISGPELVWITFPEGLRREEIVLKLISEFELQDPEEFYFDFMKYSNGKEGFLFPDTYLLPKDISSEKFVEVLYNNFIKRTESLFFDENKLKLSEIIALASIIERETKTEEERPVVAGILIKRIKAGWPLQVDATVQYAVANKNCEGFKADCKWWPVIKKEDMGINSLFNSYKFKGLPPSPISNPGLSSIKAVIYPEESEYWFYLHDKKNIVHYAKTIEEHQENIKKYLSK